MNFWLSNNRNSNKNIVLKVLKDYPNYYEDLNDELKNDKEILKLVLNENINLIKSAPENLKNDEEIINTLDKRPLTMEDIDLLFDQESKKRLEKLIEASKIVKTRVGNLEFFILHENEKRKRVK